MFNLTSTVNPAVTRRRERPWQHINSSTDLQLGYKASFTFSESNLFHLTFGENKTAVNQVAKVVITLAGVCII